MTRVQVKRGRWRGHNIFRAWESVCVAQRKNDVGENDLYIRYGTRKVKSTDDTCVHA